LKPGHYAIPKYLTLKADTSISDGIKKECSFEIKLKEDIAA